MDDIADPANYCQRFSTRTAPPFLKSGGEPALTTQV
jgi:hypothetical protein